MTPSASPPTSQVRRPLKKPHAPRQASPGYTSLSVSPTPPYSSLSPGPSSSNWPSGARQGDPIPGTATARKSTLPRQRLGSRAAENEVLLNLEAGVLGWRRAEKCPESRGGQVLGMSLTCAPAPRRACVLPEAAAALALLWSSARLRSARRGRGQGGAAVRRLEAAAAGPLHRRLAGRRECALPHRESARALRRAPAWRAQPRLSRRCASPFRRLLLPCARRARPRTRRLGLGLGGRWWLGRRRA